MKITVSEHELEPPSKPFLIVGLLIVVVILIIFIGIIYHYEHLERRLSAIYRNIKIKAEKKKGYDVETV